jgi:hypothetical protein
LKKSAKGKETQLESRVNELEKEKLALQDRMYNVEQKFNESEGAFQQEKYQLQQKLDKLNKIVSEDSFPQKQELERLKQLVEKLEVEKSDVSSVYER